MFNVSGNFFGSFVTHDNVQYNLQILRSLYSVRTNPTVAPHDRLKIIKPIILLQVSIIEAVLYDFLCIRIKTYSFEGVVGIMQSVRDAVKDSKIDDLEKYIAQAKKHDFFSESDSNFYNRLNDLREARNRIHIQNTRNYLPAKEHELFNERLLLSSEKCLEKVLKVLATHPRPVSVTQRQYMRDLVLPWSAHL